MAIDREKALLSAQKFIDKKRYDRALEEYQRVLREEPSDTRTLLKLGDLQIKMQAFADAMSTYDRVAQLYETQGFAVKAVAVYKQIRDHIQKRSPDLADRFAHVVPRLAQIYAKLQLTSDAIQAYDEVATRYLRLGRKQEAIEIYQQMVALDPNNPLTHVRLAEALCHLEEIDTGISAFRSAAELLHKLGRVDDVLRVVDRGMNFKQDPTLARLGAEVHLKRGARNDGLAALTKLQICFRADPKDLVVFGLLAQAFTLLEQPDKATEVYKEMAMLAREKGEQQLFFQLVDHLIQIAPEDDQVRALQVLAHGGPSSHAMLAAKPTSMAPQAELPQPQPEEPEEPEEIEEIDEELEFVDEPNVQAGAQRSSRRPSLQPAQAAPSQAPAALSQAPAATDPAALIQHALTDADTFRRMRLFEKSLETLNRALLLDPNSLDLRYKLREVLYESGDYQAMLAESINIAVLLIQYGYIQEAVPFVEEVLASDPDHPEAVRLYTELYGQPPARSVRPEATPESRQSSRRSGALTSYDIEGTRASRAFSSVVPPHLSEVDDPFAEVAERSEDRELPSFALDEVLTQDPASGSLSSTHYDIEQILDEADWMVQRGEHEQARALLEQQLRRSPNHPLVLEKLDEIAQLTGDRAEAPPRDQSQVKSAGLDDVDELESSFRALDDLEMHGNARRSSAAPVADVDAVFAQLKAGFRSQQVEETDSATHYDLGVAYKEMGLTGDAFKEFGIAARDPARECMCHAMMGLIHLEQNDVDLAIEAYMRGLAAKQKTNEQELSLYYDLGIAHEMKSDYNTAVHYFREIARTEPNYRDVVERINALHRPDEAVPQAKPARAVNADDDFERAFDDIFN
ncbi:MAG TPA: tetratricopeptide repeat protein [Polyangiaceae bacterium]|nr:tetratricopeptide repeat protein [Polyangiaceae bacterium]